LKVFLISKDLNVYIFKQTPPFSLTQVKVRSRNLNQGGFKFDRCGDRYVNDY